MKKPFGKLLCILLILVMMLSGCRRHERTYSGTPVDFMENLVYDSDKGFVVLWQQRPTSYKRMTGAVNVLAPTWLYVNETEGGYALQSTAEMGDSVEYTTFVTRANKDKIKVWAGAVCSGEDATYSILNDDAARRAFIERVVQFAQESGINGINLLFEDLQKKDSSVFVRLVQELKRELPSGVLLNTCVFFQTGTAAELSDSAYDFKALSESSDHLLLMAYEQFGLDSSTAGPICSYEWLYNKILKVLSAVPSNKLILILPFYGRDWRFDESGAPKWQEDPTQAPIVSYTQVDELYTQQQYYDSNEELTTSAETGLAESWDDTYMACYVKFTDTEGATHVIWYDNEESIRRKADIAVDYALAGVGVYRDIYADSHLWKGIRSAMDGAYFSERMMQVIRLHAYDFRVYNPDDKDWTQGDDTAKKRLINLISVSRTGASSGVDTGYVLSAQIRQSKDEKGQEVSWVVKEKNGQYILVPNNEYTMILTNGQSLWLPFGVTPQMMEGACMVWQPAGTKAPQSSEEKP